MSGGTPTQNAVLLTLIVLVALGIVSWVVIGRRRRAGATGSEEAGSVRSRSQAKEIADRLYSYADGASTRPRIQVRGAARLLTVLDADDRFDVTRRGAGDSYWSFVVKGPEREGGSGGDDALGRGVVQILARNGVTAQSAAGED